MIPALAILNPKTYIISPEQVKEILSIPADKLIEELEKIVNDALNRYHEVFVEKPNNEVYFALLFLSKIKHEKSLDIFITLLSRISKVDDAFEFFLYESFDSEICICIYQLIKDSPSVTKDYLCNPHIGNQVKELIVRSVAEVYLHDHSKKEEVFGIFRAFLRYIDENSVDLSQNETLYDYNYLVGCVLDLALNIKLADLPILAKPLFEKNMVDPFLFGSFQDFLVHYKKDKLAPPQKIKSFQEMIDEPGEMWRNYLLELNEISQNTQPLVKSAPKIGRNDPCLCGSGKKYKKCCG